MTKHPACEHECQQAVEYGVWPEHSCSPECVWLKLKIEFDVAPPLEIARLAAPPNPLPPGYTTKTYGRSVRLSLE